MNKDSEKLTSEEVQLELLKIAKANNKKFESIKKNVSYIATIIIISFIITIIAYIIIENKLA